MAAKKQKVDVRSFQTSWTTDYGFVQQNDRAICVLCRESVVFRTSSVQRHFQIKHESSFKDNADKREAIQRASKQYEKQSTFFSKVFQGKNQVTECSFKIAQSLAQKGRPFTDGEFMKQTFLSTGEILFDDLPNKDTILARIRDIPASARTIERRITEMTQNVQKQQRDAIKRSFVFSVALDESVDINDIARLAIVARYFDDGSVYEELICLLPLQGTTRGEDIFSEFVKHFEKRNIDLNKKFCVTTDGAPAMIGRHKGFVSLLIERMGRSVLNFHCIIHQESLCAKISAGSLKSVMDRVVKIVNYIVGRSSLIHRQFKAFLQELESAYSDIPLHNNVRWLSRGKVLSRFVQCLGEIKSFLLEKNQVDAYPELEDKNWICMLMFLTDITNHLSELNLKLQGSGKTVLDLYESWKSFKLKIDLFISDITTNTYKYFPNLKTYISSVDDGALIDEILKYMTNLKEEFIERGQDFDKHGPMFAFLIKPDLMDFSSSCFDISLFSWMDINDFDLQYIEFKSSELWNTKFVELRRVLEGDCQNHSNEILSCWMSLPEKFICLKKVAFAMLTAFGSSYICEQLFSHMRVILNPYRSRLTTDNSEACVTLKITRHEPDIRKLSKELQAQGSH